MKVLALLAHPDDETILCGGTLDKLVKNGHGVYVTFFTKNDQAFFGSEKQSDRKKRTIEEAKQSSKLLGYSLGMVDFVDMDLSVNKGELMRVCISEIRRIKPDVVITHHPRDKHIDHRTLGAIVPEANFQSGCKLCGGKVMWKAKIVLQGEIDLEMTTPFDFQVVSRLDEVNARQKMSAFNCYSSVKDEHGTDQQWLNTKLEYCLSLRGKTIESEYGEAFQISNYSPLSYSDIYLLAKVLE